MNKQGVVSIHGKEYKTVALRVTEFRESHEDWGITTDLINDGDNVIIKASITNPEGFVVATGYAEEVRGSTNINKTSAIENCETSAVGRALAAAGLSGTEYVSADEVANAMNQQIAKDMEKEAAEYMACVMHNIETVLLIKKGIQENNYSPAAEAWFELDKPTKELLWKAPTKGGCFTTQERKVMLETEFRESYYGPDGE